VLRNQDVAQFFGFRLFPVLERRLFPAHFEICLSAESVGRMAWLMA
jgi:hypothetical protein